MKEVISPEISSSLTLIGDGEKEVRKKLDR